MAEEGGLFMDFSRQRMTQETLQVGGGLAGTCVEGSRDEEAAAAAACVRRRRPRRHTKAQASPLRPMVGPTHTSLLKSCSPPPPPPPPPPPRNPASLLPAAPPQLLLKLAEAAGLPAKIQAMFAGEHINATEDRAVLHVATRARREQSIKEGGKDVVPEVWEVLDKIRAFSDKVRKGEWLGVTGKPLKNVVAVGIGGSFLGPLFVHNALE